MQAIVNPFYVHAHYAVKIFLAGIIGPGYKAVGDRFVVLVRNFNTKTDRNALFGRNGKVLVRHYVLKPAINRLVIGSVY